MSSTGIISKVYTPTTELKEQARQVDAGINSFPGLHEGVRQVFGVVFQIHPERPLVKAYDDNGSNIANSKWIPLAHSAQEIAERFGTVRRGMRILVSFVGPDGSGANATIVGNEGERHSDEPFHPNDAQRGLFRVFAPGIGLG